MKRIISIVVLGTMLSGFSFGIELIEGPSGEPLFVYSEAENEIVHRIMDDNEWLSAENKKLVVITYERDVTIRDQALDLAQQRILIRDLKAGRVRWAIGGAVIATAIHVTLKIIFNRAL